ARAARGAPSRRVRRGRRCGGRHRRPGHKRGRRGRARRVRGATMRVPVALGDRSYDIVVEESYERLSALLRGRRRVAIVTEKAVDDHVGALVGAALDDAAVPHATFTMGTGEDAK